MNTKAPVLHIQIFSSIFILCIVYNLYSSFLYCFLFRSFLSYTKLVIFQGTWVEAVCFWFAAGGSNFIYVCHFWSPNLCYFIFFIFSCSILLLQGNLCKVPVLVILHWLVICSFSSAFFEYSYILYSLSFNFSVSRKILKLLPLPAQAFWITRKHINIYYVRS